jgi:curved DNA-binding protein
MAQDFYKELGVGRSAGLDEIKKSYRKLASELHPDKRPGDKKSETRFKAVNRAYQTLSDPEKRKIYDEFGEDGLREGFDVGAARAYKEAARSGHMRGGSGGFEDIFGGGQGANIGDLFGDLFGGGGVRGRRRGGAMKGSDVAAEVTVDLPNALRGAELRLRLQDGGDEVTVRVPAGAGDGDRVRIAGHGAPGAMGGPPGDLILTIRVTPHPHFERVGLDLYLDLPITPSEAYRGAKVRVPTQDGFVTLTVPKHAQSGQVARLKGKGVKRAGKQGDFFVRFQVRLPDSESSELDEAVDVLDAAVPKNLRDGIVF